MAEKSTIDDATTHAEPCVIDGNTGRVVKPSRKRVRIPLRTAEDCRQYIARTIRRVEAETLSDEQGRSRVYMANVLIGVIETVDIERDLARIEQEDRMAIGQANGGDA
jgi:hypothetical protein